jgi:hypothetical protein
VISATRQAMSDLGMADSDWKARQLRLAAL